MSHWLYIHKDMAGTKDVWKPGIAILPYSAVRARQKFTWNQFELDHLFFGRPRHIVLLEKTIKKHFLYSSGNYLQGFGGQTELFKVPEEELLMFIRVTISKNNLDVKEILLDKPYTATNKGQCPFGCPSEADAFKWCDERVLAWFGKDRQQVLFNKFFDTLFETEN